MSGPELPPGWSCHLSRTTGLKYFFNSRTGASTYSLQDILKTEQPRDPGLGSSPAPSAVSRQHSSSTSNLLQSQPTDVRDQTIGLGSNRSIAQNNNSVAGISNQFSVTELEMMLAEKKRKLGSFNEANQEECSSVESGFGSQGGSSHDGDGEFDGDFQSGIGLKLKRKVNLWHRQTLKLEDEKIKHKPPIVEESGSNCMATEEIVEQDSKNDRTSESDEEDLYGADEEEMEQFARIKEKFQSVSNVNSIETGRGQPEHSEHLRENNTESSCNNKKNSDSDNNSINHVSLDDEKIHISDQKDKMSDNCDGKFVDDPKFSSESDTNEENSSGTDE